MPFSVRIGGADCPSGVFSSGTLGFGITTTSLTYSTIPRSQLVHGQTYAVRICVENLAGAYGEFAFSMTACDAGTHAVDGVCVGNERTEVIERGIRKSEWNPFSNTWGPWEYICDGGCSAEYGRCPPEFVYVNRVDGTKKRHCSDAVPDTFVIENFTNCGPFGCDIGRWFDVRFLFRPYSGDRYKWEWINRPGDIGFDTILEPGGYLHGPSGGCGFWPPFALCWGRMPGCYDYTFKVTDMHTTVLLEDGLTRVHPYVEKSWRLCTHP